MSRWRRHLSRYCVLSGLVSVLILFGVAEVILLFCVTVPLQRGSDVCVGCEFDVPVLSFCISKADLKHICIKPGTSQMG